MAKQDGPPTWQDALSSASQAIAAGLAAPDADLKFGLAMIGALSAHQHKGGQGSGPGGAAGPGGAPGGGQAGSPPAGGPGDAGGPPGMSPAAGPAGGGAPNSAMPSMTPPGAPTPGGMSQGLGLSGPGNNPDELRRVLADVAGK
jgi:hypothetical protein